MKRYLIFLFLLLNAACKTPAEKWLLGLDNFKEIKSDNLVLQALKVNNTPSDTTEVSYKVRIYPSKAWLADHAAVNLTSSFYYGMDSAFTLKYGNKVSRPQLVQPVANGLSNCYEYLVTIALDPAIRQKQVSLLYHDKFIDGRQYIMNLNRQ